MAVAIAIMEVFEEGGTVINALASWITTTWIKIVKTLTIYDLTEISAKSANFGSVHSKNMKGDKTAPREIKISLATYIKRRIMDSIKKITKNKRVIRETV